MSAPIADLTPEQQEALKLAEAFVRESRGRESREFRVCVALLAAQDEVAMWRKAVEEMPHEAGCSVDRCRICGDPEGSYQHIGCGGNRCHSFVRQGCNCIKSRLEKR